MPPGWEVDIPYETQYFICYLKYAGMELIRRRYRFI
jgi:hypothetical protein